MKSSGGIGVRRAGFTLIELMAAVAIVGVLATVLTPTVGNMVNDAKKAKATAETKSIVDAIGAYKIVNGNYPPVWNDPTYSYYYSDWGGSSGGQLNPWLVDGSPKFLAKAITTDPWGRAYSYHLYTRANPYQDVVVYSDGPNRVNESWDGGVWNRGVFNGDDIGAFFDAEN